MTQQNLPIPSLLLVVAIATAGLVVWAEITRRLRQGQSLLVQEPRRDVPWGVVEVLFILAVYILLQGAALFVVGIADAADPATADHGLLTQLLAANAIANLLAVAAGVAVLVAFSRAGMADLGLPASARTFRFDLYLGAATFAAMVLPVYAIQLLLTRWQPSRHPIVELVEQQFDLPTAALILFAAVIVAPIAEEFAFRLLLQGWLESLANRWPPDGVAWWIEPSRWADSRDVQVMSTEPATDSISPAASGIDAPPSDTPPSDTPPSDTPPSDSAPPLSLPQSPAGEENPSRAPAGRWPRGAIPIVLSALAFALMHLGHGPDPIPLFVLALALGFVYQRTHRLLPCVVIHLLFNGFSLALLYSSLLAQPAPVP